MTITYFSKCSLIGPSSRYRIFQFLPHLQAEGIDCAVDPLFDEAYFDILAMRPSIRLMLTIPYVLARFLKRLWHLLILGKRDLIVVEGQLFPYLPPLAERLLRWCGYPVVIEMDDAIYLTRGHAKKMPVLLAMANGAIVGNEQLASYARQFSPQVWVVPTVVDTDRFVPKRQFIGPSVGPSHDIITLVWMGLAYNLKYLGMLAPALRALQSRFHLRLRVVCSRPPQLAGINMEFRAWAMEREVTDLQDAAIGVMPLDDTAWARGKCGLKLLQYMAVGLPAIASPVGVNRDIVTTGHNGFLASTVQEWYDCLEALCGRPQLRQEMGLEGRRTVEQRYSLAVWGPRLPHVYHALVRGEPVPSGGHPRHSPVAGAEHSAGVR
jgi:glycosyltransferase involved in cell wall biosynthesis